MRARPTFHHGGVSAEMETSGFLNVRATYVAEPADWLAFGQWLLDTFGEPVWVKFPSTTP